MAGIKKLLIQLSLLVALGCNDHADENIHWPQYDDIPKNGVDITDPPEDLELAPGEAPSAVIAYPAADLSRVRVWTSEGYLFFRLDFNGTIPTAKQMISGHTVEEQGFNVSIDTDDDPSTGVSISGIGGVDIFFGVKAVYGEGALRPYANFNFQTNDIHSSTGQIEGELRGGGPGHSFATFRFQRSRLNNLYQAGHTAKVGGWSEAESNQFHHFAYDPLTTVSAVLP